MSDASAPYPAPVLLAILAPEFANAPAQAVTDALGVAATHCPATLSPGRRQEAMALYAAWLLSLRASSLSGSGTAGAGQALRREKEGELEIEYLPRALTGAEAEAAGNYRARYEALLRPFSTGAVLTGEPE
ncbi:DUF4054 domain-containing protein [Granulibacter bethesdensis]|uniref:DUF4054 domain-containing protein n=1 Tax=Granulibacter bethesdensis TaxID=364410 RepID=UPI00090B9B1B|nr:DUF4054 domain-containing protein [Granulibacter bethesdensis]APH59921.1 putative secreted protein [Granulibacter bethesdensis]